MKVYSAVIPATELFRNLGRPDWRVFDCRYSLDQPTRGRAAFRESRIPGARYLHLDEELSGPIIPGRTGRHPLPETEQFSALMRRHGVSASTQVVVYDDSGGSIAGRLWWLLQWMGHERVAVLDGGWNRWMSSGLPFDAAPVPPLPEEQGSFQGSPRRELVADLEEVIALLAARQGGRLIDARAPERFRGEMEPIDPVAGHIPGARNRPFALNLTLDGTFKQPEQLAEEFARLLDELPAADAVCYCGSGVTGAHLALAFRHAGLSMPRLYPGSWSEWITDPARPVALGD